MLKDDLMSSLTSSSPDEAITQNGFDTPGLRQEMSREKWNVRTNANKENLNALRNESRRNIDPIIEEKIMKYIQEHETWRTQVPYLRTFEYWRLRAEYYPYIKESDKRDYFFLRGVTCHPRLSDYPMCIDVIRDFFVCREDAGITGALFNMCAPLKEQISSCINLVYMKNHERAGVKLNDSREGMFEAAREKKFDKMVRQAQGSITSRDSFSD